MPLYEYRCAACQHEFETMQKVDAPRLRKCPECGGRLEKLISRSAFHLKGGGWYSDGYGGKSKESAKQGGAAKKSKKPANESGTKKSKGSSGGAGSSGAKRACSA